jgi:hypothetical protein
MHLTQVLKELNSSEISKVIHNKYLLEACTIPLDYKKLGNRLKCLDIGGSRLSNHKKQNMRIKNTLQA